MLQDLLPGLPEYYIFAMNLPEDVSEAMKASGPIYQELIRIAHERMPEEHGHPQKCDADIVAAMKKHIEAHSLDAVLFAAAQAFTHLGYLSSYCGVSKGDVGLK